MTETVNTIVSDADPKQMSTTQLLDEYADITDRLRDSGKLAGWLCSRLETRRSQLARTLADNMLKNKGVNSND
ncbi:MAG: hypothetical protein ACYTEQ_14445 [Planctomycetota bacterium]